MQAIVIEDLNLQYKNGVRALNGLSLQAEQGEIFSLLGPNGAGKSSLIHILTTFLNPTSGKVSILGRDLRKDAGFVRSNVACVAQQVSIDSHLSLRENMLFQSRLYHVERRTARERIDSLIQGFALEEYARYPVASYSGGVRRRLDIAMTMVSHPRVLFLDEPTVGMDIVSRQSMWEMMKKIRTEFGTTIFLTTHYLEEADMLSDTVCIMKDGKEVVQDAPNRLRSHLRRNRLRICFAAEDGAQTCAAALQSTGLAHSAQAQGVQVLAGVSDGERGLSEVTRWLLDQGLPFTGAELIQPSLEDVFLSLTSSQQGGNNHEHL